MKKLIFTAVVLASCLLGWAGQTLVKREMFYGPGTYTSGNPGTNLSSVTGTLYLKPGGPTLSGETGRGWSADGNAGPTSQAAFAIGNVAIPGAGAWVYVKSLYWDGGNTGQLLWVGFGSATAFHYQWSIYLNTIIACAGAHEADGLYLTNAVNFTSGWIWLQIVCDNPTTSFYYKLPGGSLTLLGSVGGLGQNPAGYVSYAGFSPALGTYTHLIGRIGSACAFSNTDLDAEYPSDIVEPDTAGMKWYVDSANGSDDNTGDSPAAAWKTISKINLESGTSGMFASESWQTGNELLINTPTPFLLQGTNLEFQTDGLNVHAATNGNWIQVRGDKILTNASFTKTGSYTNTYQTSDIETSVTVWEDEKWLNHPSGASWDAVANSVDGTPGSFWTDGSALYLHPFGNSSPTSDGKVYTRTYAATEQAGLITMNAANMRVADVCAGKNTDLATNNIGGAGYVLSSGNSFGGNSVIEHCYLYYGGKHILAFIGQATGSDIVITNVDCEQGSPYSGFGGQTPFVSFSPGGTNNIHRYYHCTNLFTQGLIGSTNGCNLGNYGSFYSHSTGGPVPWDLIEVVNCTSGGDWPTGPAWTNRFIGGTLFGSFNYEPAGVTYDQIRFTGSGPSAVGAGSDLVRNCLLVANPGWQAMRVYTGQVSFVNCTIDLRGSTNELNFLTRFDAATVTFSNNIVILATNGYPFDGFIYTDSINEGHNLYTVRSDGLICYQFNGDLNLTFAQWQSYGLAKASKITIDARLDANYRPYGDSLAIGMAQPTLGQDMIGPWSGLRRTAGAIEYRRPGGLRGFAP
jgi:hypothetical protein